MNTPEEAEQQLGALLTEYGTLAARRGKPNRYHARDTLLALGHVALAGGNDAAAPWVERLLAALAPFAEGFEAAARDELAVATDEHVRSVDPRFLQHPRYDFHYTVLARERLEARLVAADLLGIEPDEDLLERIAAADLALEPYLAGPGAEGPTAEGPER